MPGRQSGGRLTARRQRPFASLSDDDLLQLLHWLAAACSFEIETVADLGGRPWPAPRPDVILGVFRKGERQACWLIAGQAGQWVAAAPGEGRITAPSASLLEVLERIQRVRTGSASG
jgi:hypothetical protein